MFQVYQLLFHFVARECYLSYGEIRMCFLLFRVGRGSLLFFFFIFKKFVYFIFGCVGSSLSSLMHAGFL